MTARALGGLLACFVTAAPVLAHEVRPAYLELQATASAIYEVTWKVPLLGDSRPNLAPRLPASCRALTPRTAMRSAAAVVERWQVACEPLEGSLEIAGLEATLMDVLVRIDAPAGERLEILRPDRPAMALGPGMTSETRSAVAAGYLRLGIGHILAGIDHLLFVALLMLLVRGGWRLFQAVTAFTLGHSITLAAATLGWVHIPGPPVEAVIALSILFLAVELAEHRTQKPALTARRPWIVAGAFGLLHGFGFAGALAEVGLPAADIPLALLFFNLGVEAGQWIFIAVLLLLLAAWRRLPVLWPRGLRALPAYGLGALAAFWFFERLAAF